MSRSMDRIDDLPNESLSRRGFCRAGIAAAALITTTGLPLFAQDVKPADGTVTKPDEPAKTEPATQTTPATPATPAKPGDEKPAEPKPEVKEDPVKFQELFVPEEFPKGWFYFAAEDGPKLETTWKSAKDATTGETILQCLGKPYGYLRTLEVFDNYEFGLKWRFPSDPNGNSGILLHTEDDRIWPKSIQVQLHRPKAGSVFPSGEATSDNQLAAKDLSKPLNEWNECIIRCVDGTISVEINKKKVGEVTGCKPNKGRIALQSEGSEIHFQQIRIRKLS